MTLFANFTENSNLRDPLPNLVPMFDVHLPGKPENNLNYICEKEDKVTRKKTEILAKYNQGEKFSLMAYNPENNVPRFAAQVVVEFSSVKKDKHVAERLHKIKVAQCKEQCLKQAKLIRHEQQRVKQNFNKLQTAFIEGVKI